MEIWKFTAKISGHLKDITKIGGDYDDCLWKLKYDYREVRKFEVINSQIIQKIPLSDGLEIHKYHEKYLFNCNLILQNLKFNELGYEVFD